jgi:PAS domain S-box-containing protein
VLEPNPQGETSMEHQVSVIHIGLVGGGEFCAEILKKTTAVYEQEEIYAPFLAVADPDPHSPGMRLADRMGLLTFSDYHDLYDPRYNINLIVILTPEEDILRDILQTRPERIRILSYPVFRVFWKAIGREELKLRERTTEMETILNGIKDFILVITPDMSIVDANESFFQKMGYSRDSVVGRKCHEVYHSSDRPCERPGEVCPLQEVVRNKRQVRRIQQRVLPSGELRYYEVSVYPIWEKDGKISRFVHISRDITEQRREEEEITRRLGQMVDDRTRQLRETHEKLLHQDRMSSLGKLSAAVVHEINNPIAGILNLVLLMKRMIDEQALGPADVEQFKLYLGLMETETRRTGRIVSNLLAFSRQPILDRAGVDINRLIDQTLLITANLLKIAEVRLEKDMAPDLPAMVGSGDQLQQVFMNLVSNAAEAMEGRGGGSLRIETRLSPGGDQLLIRIADTGAGIPPENMSKLFVPFFTTKKKGKGVGLGLSVAYGIIQEHGGAIQVESFPGKGAAFTVSLPLPPSATQPPLQGGLYEPLPDSDRRR